MNTSIGKLLPRLLSSLLLAGLLLPGCAGLSPRPSPADEAALRELETLRPSLTAPEDSLVLDLLIGYRTLAAGGTDAEALGRAHAARTRLEHRLRHGGLQEPEEGRAVDAGGDRITLIDAVEQMSDALLRNTPGTPWRPESERAREIHRHRGDLSFLVEDAEWVLTLAAALEGDLPEADKQRLRAVHEHYASGAPHSETAAKVNALLGDLKDERLRRELKKLANRSWERERRAMRDSATGGEPPVPPVPAPAPSPVVSDEDSVPVSGGRDTGSAVPPLPLPVPSADSADSGAGVLLMPPEPLTTPPEHYCEERREEAARSFASARAAGNGDEKTRFLRKSLELLDDCLQRHPETEAAQKARRNREMVQRELDAQ